MASQLAMLIVKSAEHFLIHKLNHTEHDAFAIGSWMRGPSTAEHGTSLIFVPGFEELKQETLPRRRRIRQPLKQN